MLPSPGAGAPVGGASAVAMRLGDRTAALRRWLVATFGSDALSAGSGVMDVAAGKGALAWQLNRIAGVASFAVEPRPLELDRLERRLAWGFFEEEEVEVGGASGTGGTRDAAIEHVRLFFDYERSDGGVVPALADEVAFEAASLRAHAMQKSDARHGWREEEEKMRGGGAVVVNNNTSVAAVAVVVAAAALAPAPAPAPSPAAEDAAQDSPVRDEANVTSSSARVASLERARELVRGCSVVVGLHPDEATEAIVDFALEHGKPFAIIPCCVHSKRFQSRRIIDVTTGEKSVPVRSFESFVKYLAAKDDEIRVTKLPMRGRNTLIYHLGEAEHHIKI